MKQVVAWTVSPTLFWLGHAVSVLMRAPWEFMGHLYPIYNKLMGWSCSVEDWAGVHVMWDAAPEVTR